MARLSVTVHLVGTPVLLFLMAALWVGIFVLLGWLGIVHVYDR